MLSIVAISLVNRLAVSISGSSTTSIIARTFSRLGSGRLRSPRGLGCSPCCEHPVATPTQRLCTRGNPGAQQILLCSKTGLHETVDRRRYGSGPAMPIVLTTLSGGSHGRINCTARSRTPPLHAITHHSLASSPNALDSTEACECESSGRIISRSCDRDLIPRSPSRRP